MIIAWRGAPAAGPRPVTSRAGAPDVLYSPAMQRTALGGSRDAAPAGGFELSPQQVTFFETFGFLVLRGLFAAEVQQISEGFDDAFSRYADRAVVTHCHVHFDEPRRTLSNIVEACPQLQFLLDDPRVDAIATALVGEGYEYAESDGSIFTSGTSWHVDVYGSPLDRLHLKLQWYLEPLSAASGALRVIPGTNHHLSDFAVRVRSGVGLEGDREDIVHAFGVEPEELPCWRLDTEPGDLLVWSFRTVHASFGAIGPRRALAMNFREPR